MSPATGNLKEAGHRSEKVTRDTYIHICFEELEDLYEAVEDMYEIPETEF